MMDNSIYSYVDSPETQLSYYFLNKYKLKIMAITIDSVLDNIKEIDKTEAIRALDAKGERYWIKVDKNDRHNIKLIINAHKQLLVLNSKKTKSNDFYKRFHVWKCQRCKVSKVSFKKPRVTHFKLSCSHDWYKG